MEQLEEIFVKLEINETNGLFFTKDDNWKTQTAFPNRVQRLLEHKINPDAFFCFDNKPVILFFNNPQNKGELHRAIWNFNECPLVIIVEHGLIEIFNGFNYIKDKASLEKLGNTNTLNDFSYFKLVTGRTWEEFKDNFNYRNRVDFHLLSNIKSARKSLVEKHNLNAKTANAIIGKVIFVRYLIDRKVKMKFDGRLRNWTNIEFCGLLDAPQKIESFFAYLEDKERGFDGNLFPLDQKEYKSVDKSSYQVLKRLLLGEDIETNQQSLFELYDFSIIPIEFISNVYELFIGQENQKKEGAYYTPLFLVDYILKETVEKYLNVQHKENTLNNTVAKNEYSYCKVLDPACGSGIFLVETLRKIIEKYILETNIDTKSSSFKTAIKKLAQENIFGIDKDLSAVQVAVFSIYLTLLDYLEPPSIENFKFPILLDTNFFVADFFDKTVSFNEIFAKISFDFILGNPPWMRGKGEKAKPIYINYIEERRRKENVQNGPAIDIGNKEIAQAFVLRSSDFSTENTACALIVTSKVLYNLQSAPFREYFLNQYRISKVFELAPVRREVFDRSNDQAIAPACILFFKYANGQGTRDNIVEHISLKPSKFFTLFKIFTINRSDYKAVKQEMLISYDWLWKTLVYGSYLDFLFLKRLKESFKSINHYFQEHSVLVKQGIKRKDGNKKIDVQQLVGWDFLDLNKKEIQQYHIASNHSKWTLKDVGYIYREYGQICTDVFSPPVLLVKETVNTSLESVSAISSKKILFTDKVTSIKFRGKTDIKDYYLLAGLMNSSLFAYYILNSSSTAGIMIEQQINDIERFLFPYKYSDEIINLGIEIEKIKKDAEKDILTDSDKLQNIEEKTYQIQDEIFSLFELSAVERSLVDYARHVMIPISMKHEGHSNLFKPLKSNDVELNKYAGLYIERFKTGLEQSGKKFIVEIWHSNQIIGMFFKLVPATEYSNDIIWLDKTDKEIEIMSLLAKISSHHVTDRLFVQKDIRGFEGDNFYLFKPNESRLWHKAIGYVDINDFAEAILTAGRASD
ncbi:MAG TPA: N-6 DNA methylase [Mucilaginibacter sp.]|nr:N-6 DNA methylase [Mucilaginibacter sp.]